MDTRRTLPGIGTTDRTLTLARHSGRGRELAGPIAAVMIAGTVIGLMGCQEINREEKRFGPPTIGGPPRTAAPDAEAETARTASGSTGVTAPATDRVVATDDGPVMGSFENPVKAHGAAGQQAYLKRLRDSDGRPVVFRREGTFLNAEGVPLDGYRISSASGDGEQLVFLDLHHPGYREARPLPGYRLVSPDAAVSRERR